MTPAAYIALARDLIILVALGLLIWLLISFGSDRVKVADMKALQKQITANATTEATWRKEQTDANTKRDADLAQVAAGIAGQRAPVYVVRNGPARACPMSEHSGQAGAPSAQAGGVDSGPRGDSQPINLRPAINFFELKYESAIADGQACLDGWPQ